MLRTSRCSPVSAATDFASMCTSRGSGRPRSLSSELFGPIFVPDELREAVSGRAWLQAMLDAERALAAATGVQGVAEACDASLYDLDEIARQGRAPGNPVEPLVRALRERSGVAEAHRGATS